MFSENDFQSWCQSLKLSEQAQSLISQIRASDPSRHVRSAVGNVSGRYPSRKMKRTVQFESHRNELAAILELEHNPDVIEFYDQPTPIQLHYRSAKGKALSTLHTPDYFVIGQASAAWVECKTQEQLLKLADSQPNRFYFDQSDKVWRCPPGEAYAAQFGLGYIVRSSADIDWVYQRNVLFLEDFLRAESLEVSAEMIDYLRSRAAATPGRALSEFLEETSRNGLSGDCIYIAIVTDQIYVDLRAVPLAEPERVRVYFDEASARLYRDTGRHPSPFLPPTTPNPPMSSILNWDGKAWEIVNRGESSVWLKDDAGSVISLSEQALSNLLSQGSAQAVPVPSPASETDSKSAKELLAQASATDLAEANRRYAILTAYRAGGWNQELGVTLRTIQRWEADARQAEAVYQCGYAGLLPRIRNSGNRTPKLPEETRKLMEEYVGKEYENERQPTRFAVWSKLLHECESRGLSAPSYRAFCQFVGRRPRHEQLKKRQGRRAAYQVKEFFYELSEQTPRHGDRPFEIAHIDHTELDIELVCSQTGGNLGRPWASFMTDAFSRRLLAVYLSFDPPSYRSCMMIFRECVSRHHRLPQIIVIDGGREFESVYFETLLARYEIVKKTRPPSQSRFGSVCERLFGVANTRFIYNLAGNTQMTKGNLRLITKEVDPKNLAVWTFGALDARLREVYGPTGVGKTTLRQHITSRLIEGAEGDSGSEEHQLPVLALEAAAPESGNFHWGHFFRQALGELEAPFLKDKVQYAANTAYFDRAGNYIISLRATARDLRLSVEQAMRYRQPRAVIIDEAQHLTKISSGRRLQEQMDVLKSLANQTGSLLVLIGTYELLTFHGLSGQLSRRSVSVHFPRYGSGTEDLKAFQSVLYGFQRRLPVMEEPDLLKHWEYCYVRSIGCVGILKDWLVRALGASMVEGGRTVSVRHLEETALSVWQCEQIARETLAGEERLEEKPGSMTRLTEMLGLVVKQMASPAAGDDSLAEVCDVVVEKKVEKPRSKRRVGQRKPKRDPLS